MVAGPSVEDCFVGEDTMAITLPGDGGKPWRIRLRLLAVLGLGLLVAVALASVLYLGFSVATRNTMELMKDEISNTLDIFSERLDQNLQPVERQALEIGKAVASGMVSVDNRGEFEAYLVGVLSASPQVVAIDIVLPGGKMLSILRQDYEIRDDRLPAGDRLARLIGQPDGRALPVWSPPFWSDRLQQLVLTLQTPLVRDRQMSAILIQTVPVSALSQYLTAQAYSEGVPFIFYDRNKLIAHPKLGSWRPALDRQNGANPTLRSIGDTFLETLLSAPWQKPGTFSGLKYSGGRMIIVDKRAYVLFTRQIFRYGSKPWTMGLYLDARAAGHVMRQLIRALVTGGAFLVLTVCLAMLAGSRLSQAIHSLSRAMSMVREGGVLTVRDLPPSRIRELDDAARSFNDMVGGLRERNLIRKTLGRYVPEKVAESLLQENGALKTEEIVATVLFADIENFTGLTESLGPEGIVTLLNAFFNDMVEIIERHDGVVTQFQGDAILATFNVPIKNDNHATHALKAAIEMRHRFQTRHFAGHAVRARIGVNSGPLIAGAVGARGRLNYTVHGDAVNLAARIENLNRQFGTCLLAAQSTVDLAEDLDFSFVGEAAVRGQTSSVRLYTLINTDIGTGAGMS